MEENQTRSEEKQPAPETGKETRTGTENTGKEKGEARLQALFRQAADFSRREPRFRLEREMRNPAFCRLLARGVPTEAAFALTHGGDAILGAMAYAIAQTGRRSAGLLRAAGNRPGESAMGAGAQGASAPDPRDMSPGDRAAMRKAVALGRKIYL